ncbi:hypothetical protein BDU57DRAFT_531656 [Ampelomyces quisqualis]|uniref:Uncharacterized protein n=1 Tax=Ampelomyces quisqualis TaxID=50730 RepID=A0A6A5QIA8_AMPQU|nr:hypothetical protein BDU57DRAFT_531656 [Ampelomyces quisqualis]
MSPPAPGGRCNQRPSANTNKASLACCAPAARSGSATPLALTRDMFARCFCLAEETMCARAHVHGMCSFHAKQHSYPCLLLFANNKPPWSCLSVPSAPLRLPVAYYAMVAPASPPGHGLTQNGKRPRCGPRHTWQQTMSAQHADARASDKYDHFLACVCVCRRSRSNSNSP